MKNKHLAGIIAGCLLILSVGLAQEPDITVEGSNTTRFDTGVEVDRNRAEFGYPDNTIARHFIENRLRLDLYRGNLRVGGRLLYYRPSEGDQAQYGLPSESRFDKRYLEATFDWFKLRAGHYSDLWGHGLVLSLFENRDLYFDSELDGVRAEADVGPFVVTGLRGSSAPGFLVKEADVTGAHIGSLFGGSGLGFSYAFLDSGYYLQANISGIDWRVARGIFTLYGERAWKQTTLQSTTANGHATYVGMVVSKWNWSLLVDYKDYAYGIPTPFQNPPTVYREIGPRLLQGREPHVMEPGNEVGFQGELSGRPLNKTFVTAHYNLTSHHPTKDAVIEGIESVVPLPGLHEEDWPFWESFFSVEQDLPHERSLFVELGANGQKANEWQERQWAWVRFRTPIGGKGTLDIETEQMQVTKKNPVLGDEDFHDQSYSLGWEPAESFSLTVQGQFTNDESIKRKEGDMWLAGEMAVLFGKGAHRLIAFYGRERGGLRCSSGVCRQVQAFQGMRLTLEVSL